MKGITEERLKERQSGMRSYQDDYALIGELIEECQEIDTLTVPKKSSLDRFKEIEIEVNQEESPLERLRFFCSLAMNDQDWLDSEQFFDDIESVDTLTVSKLRPFLELDIGREVLIYCQDESGVYFHGTLRLMEDGFLYDDDGIPYDIKSINAIGWLMIPIYKPELAGDGE